MRIAQVDYGLIPGVDDPDALLDRFQTLTRWSEALLAAGASFVSVVQRFGRDLRIERNGVDYVFRHSIRRMHEAACQLHLDVAHVNGLGFPAETWLLRRALPAPTAIVIQDHGSMPPTDSAVVALALRRAIWRRGLGVADGFLFTAPEQAAGWKAAGLIAETQRVSTVLESSTDFASRPRADARHKSDVLGDPAILWVGRLNANKDPLTALDGFERSISALPDARLTMVYSADDLIAEVRRRIAGSDVLRGRVTLAGEVTPQRMPDYFSAADIFLLGSHHEGSGYALLEACACGTVPVVTDIPSFRAITDDGAVGKLWRVGDAAACGNALVTCATGDRDRARARVRLRFDEALSWRAVGAAAMAAYADAKGRSSKC